MIRRPYLLFLGDAADDLAIKIGHGLMYWRRDRCLGQCRLPGCKPDLGLDHLSPAEARAVPGGRRRRGRRATIET